MSTGDAFRSPVAGFNGMILFRLDTPRLDPVPPERFELWDPATGSTTPEWSTEPDKQDFILDQDGEWLVTVRAGYSLPFAAWDLILRNLATGEARSIARGDASITKIPNLPVRLPYGFAPVASISGNQVVWAEFFLDEDGRPARRLQLYNIATGQTATVVSSTAAISEEIWSPSIAGQNVAWAHRASQTAPEEIVLYDLVTRQTKSIPVGTDVYSCTLSPDGRFLVWDENLNAKYALNLQTGEKLRYLSNEGWGMFRSEEFMSWTPSTLTGGAAGYYDLPAKQLRFVLRSKDIVTNVGQVMGPWFVWQMMDSVKADKGDYSTSFYYVMRILGEH